MSTKRVADILFCLDSSGSMQPCIDGVRRHIGDFVAALKSDPQVAWDLRFGFLAHRAGETGRSVIVPLETIGRSGLEVIGALYQPANGGAQAGGAAGGDFFTRDVEQFRTALGRVKAEGDEAPLIALDVALDFPWREAAGCHRVIVMMTDEPFETGVYLEPQRAALAELIKKVQEMRVMLYLVAPQSDVFDQLASVDKSEYQTVDEHGAGLSTVDFRKVLEQIGKSVSVSTQQGPSRGASVRRGLFGQAEWTGTREAVRGA